MKDNSRLLNSFFFLSLFFFPASMARPCVTRPYGSKRCSPSVLGRPSAHQLTAGLLNAEQAVHKTASKGKVVKHPNTHGTADHTQICTSTRNCSVKSYCKNESGALSMAKYVQMLLVLHYRKTFHRNSRWRSGTWWNPLVLSGMGWNDDPHVDVSHRDECVGDEGVLDRNLYALCPEMLVAKNNNSQYSRGGALVWVTGFAGRRCGRDFICTNSIHWS